MCVVVGRGGGLQIRRGEATRYAGFEAFGAHLHTCLPRSGCWVTGPELGLWALPFAYACKEERVCEREAGPQAPRPQPSGWLQVGMLRCCVCVRLREGAPLHPPPCQACPPFLSRPVPPAVWQSGSPSPRPLRG